MDKEPEALRLAEYLDAIVVAPRAGLIVTDAAAELRRLHVENKALREANDTFASERILPDHLVIVEKAEVEELLEALKTLCDSHDRFSGGAWDNARAAIAKATGEQA